MKQYLSNIDTAGWSLIVAFLACIFPSTDLHITGIRLWYYINFIYCVRISYSKSRMMFLTGSATVVMINLMAMTSFGAFLCLPPQGDDFAYRATLFLIGLVLTAYSTRHFEGLCKKEDAYFNTR